MEKYIVYCTTCTENNKIYVGMHKTANPDVFDCYLGCGCYSNEPSSYIHGKTIFQRAVHKYGPSKFIRKTLKVFDTEEEASDLEADIVNEEFIKRPDVYNMVLGGTGGDRGLNAQPCYQYDLEGNFIKEYTNRQEASRSVNKGFTTIKRAIKEHIKAADSFWSDVKVDKLDLSKYKTTTNRIPVFEYFENGDYCCCYESYSEAARKNNVALASIKQAALCGYKLNNIYYSLEFNMQFSDAKLQQLKNSEVYLYSIDGKFINKFENVKSLQSYLKTKSDLFKYIRMQKPFRDYQISFEYVSNMPDRSIKKPAKRSILQYDLEGNLIREFDSVSECVKLYGTGVKHCLTGRNKQSKGFIYKYKD